MKYFLILPAFILATHLLWSQGVHISEASGNPHPSSILDVESNSRGLLIPRLTSEQRDAIPSPSRGLVIYNLDTDCENFFNGTHWRELCGTCLPQPSVSNAGPDQLDIPGNTTQLAGNTPGAGNTGTWSVVSGSGGILDNPSDPQSGFTGQYGQVYTLRWTHTNTCGSQQDDVQVSFIVDCPATMSDADGNVYNVIGIGSRCWMQENLRTTTYRSGLPIPHLISNSSWTSDTEGGYSWYNNDPGNASSFGALYNWFAVAGSEQVCPAGWRVSLDADWNDLILFVDPSASVSLVWTYSTTGGPALKAVTGWDPYEWATPPVEMTNSTGFTGIAAGYRRPDSGDYQSVGQEAYWWTNAEYSESSGIGASLAFTGNEVVKTAQNKRHGYAVRCVKE